jgi:hypothetical protein
MPHCLTQILPVVRHHVEDEESATGLERANGFRNHACWIDGIVEHEKEKRDVGFSISERECFEASIPDVDILGPVKPLFGGGQHRARFIDCDYTLDEWRQRLCDRAGPASEVGDDPRFIEQSEQGNIGASSEQLETHPVPLTSGGREELLRPSAALGEHGLCSTRIVVGGARVHDFVAHDVPKPATCRV